MERGGGVRPPSWRVEFLANCGEKLGFFCGRGGHRCCVIDNECWNGGFVSVHDTIVNPPKVLGTELLICNGATYIQSITALGLMQCFLAMPTCRSVLVEIVSGSVTPILMEEVIALANGSCTFWSKPGLRVRLHLVRTMWNVDLHSNLKPFAKLLRRLVDIVTENQVIRNLA